MRPRGRGRHGLSRRPDNGVAGHDESDLPQRAPAFGMPAEEHRRELHGVLGRQRGEGAELLPLRELVREDGRGGVLLLVSESSGGGDGVLSCKRRRNSIPPNIFQGTWGIAHPRDMQPGQDKLLPREEGERRRAREPLSRHCKCLPRLTLLCFPISSRRLNTP